jgi:hypothetical protein
MSILAISQVPRRPHYTSAMFYDPSRTSTPDSFPAGGQPLPGGVGYPPGLVEEFQAGASPPPGLILAPHVCTHRPLVSGNRFPVDR